METKNICGKIPLDLHTKVRAEIEQQGISTQQFLQKVIEEHFMEKGVDSMAARTIAVQVTEELFGRLKAAVAWKGCKQKDFLIGIIEKAIAEVEAEQRAKQQAAAEPEDETADEPESVVEEATPEEPEDEAVEETADDSECVTAKEATGETEDETVEEAAGEPESETVEESAEEPETGASAEWEPQAENPAEIPVA